MEKDTALSWEILEYPYRKKGADWFWALGIIALAGAATSVLFGNILFAILIIIGAFTMALFAARKPERISVALSSKGVLVGNRLYPFSSILSFYVIPEERVLLLKTQNPLSPQLLIAINDVSPDDVRLFLNSYLEEKEQEYNSIPDRIGDFLGF